MVGQGNDKLSFSKGQALEDDRPIPFGPALGASVALVVERSADGVLWRANFLTRAADGTTTEDKSEWKYQPEFYADLLRLQLAFDRYVLQSDRAVPR